MHRKRKFLDIGYHYVIRRDGSLETGRPPLTTGAHAKGFNKNSIGVCMVGGVSEEGEPENNFTYSQFTTLKSLLNLLPKLTSNKVEILGHRDLPDVAKECPCFDVKEWLANF